MSRYSLQQLCSSIRVRVQLSYLDKDRYNYTFVYLIFRLFNRSREDKREVYNTLTGSTVIS